MRLQLAAVNEVSSDREFERARGLLEQILKLLEQVAPSLLRLLPGELAELTPERLGAIKLVDVQIDQTHRLSVGRRAQDFQMDGPTLPNTAGELQLSAIGQCDLIGILGWVMDHVRVVEYRQIKQPARRRPGILQMAMASASTSAWCAWNLLQ